MYFTYSRDLLASNSSNLDDLQPWQRRREREDGVLRDNVRNTIRTRLAAQPALRLPGSLHNNITKLCSLGITRTHCPSAAVTLCIGTPLIQWNENLGLNPKITDVRFLVDAQCLDLLRTLGESTMAAKNLFARGGGGGSNIKKKLYLTDIIFHCCR